METLRLIVGFLGFLAATVFFLFLMTRAPAGSRHFFIITGVITGEVAFFYLTMSTGSTSTIIEGRIFYWGRYIDWVTRRRSCCWTWRCSRWQAGGATST